MWAAIIEIKNALRPLAFETHSLFQMLPRLSQSVDMLSKRQDVLEHQVMRLDDRLNDRKSVPPPGGYMVSPNDDDSGVWDVRNAHGIERKVKKSDPSELLAALEMRSELKTYRGIKTHTATIATHVLAVVVTAGLAILWQTLHR